MTENPVIAQVANAGLRARVSKEAVRLVRPLLFGADDAALTEYLTDLLESEGADVAASTAARRLIVMETRLMPRPSEATLREQRARSVVIASALAAAVSHTLAVGPA